jgi:hypothetical protein
MWAGSDRYEIGQKKLEQAEYHDYDPDELRESAPEKYDYSQEYQDYGIRIDQ